MNIDNYNPFDESVAMLHYFLDVINMIQPQDLNNHELKKTVWYVPENELIQHQQKLLEATASVWFTLIQYNVYYFSQVSNSITEHLRKNKYSNNQQIRTLIHLDMIELFKKNHSPLVEKTFQTYPILKDAYSYILDVLISDWLEVAFNPKAQVYSPHINFLKKLIVDVSLHRYKNGFGDSDYQIDSNDLIYCHIVNMRSVYRSLKIAIESLHPQTKKMDCSLEDFFREEPSFSSIIQSLRIVEKEFQSSLTTILGYILSNRNDSYGDCSLTTFIIFLEKIRAIVDECNLIESERTFIYEIIQKHIYQYCIECSNQYRSDLNSILIYVLAAHEYVFRIMSSNQFQSQYSQEHGISPERYCISFLKIIKHYHHRQFDKMQSIPLLSLEQLEMYIITDRTILETMQSLRSYPLLYITSVASVDEYSGLNARVPKVTFAQLAEDILSLCNNQHLDSTDEACDSSFSFTQELHIDRLRQYKNYKTEQIEHIKELENKLDHLNDQREYAFISKPPATLKFTNYPLTGGGRSAFKKISKF
ncbi:MAG: hypothetical protein FJ161_02440 [Gammaproteobacteria bacterium]|nr:hypothetical protein [Gammaproteobacteria bacterium]